VGVVSTCVYPTTGCISTGPSDPVSNTTDGQLSGTSMATPFVSAAVALVKEECPSYTVAQVKALLQHNSAGAVPNFAFNRLDAGAAVTAAAGCPASP
jgi:subtilisin family serine protease